MQPETHYTKSGEVHIAYQVTGEGPLDLVLVPGFVSHLEAGWQSENRVPFFSAARIIFPVDPIRQTGHGTIGSQLASLYT